MLNTRRRDDPASDRGNSLLAAALASKRTGPGIFLFSQECHLLFANKQALQFNQRLSEAGRCQTGQGLIAPSIIKFSEEVSASLRLKPEPKDWETYKPERIAFAQPHSLLLRGIEISKIRSVLIPIETMREQQHAEPGFRPLLFPLTLSDTFFSLSLSLSNTLLPRHLRSFPPRACGVNSSQRSAGSIQEKAVSFQRSAVSRQPSVNSRQGSVISKQATAERQRW